MLYFKKSPLNLSEETKLVKKAKTNLESFEKLYDYYFPKVYAFVKNRVEKRVQAEDLTAEIFLKILEGLPRYRFMGLPFGAWVFKIARNRLLDFYADEKFKKTAQIEEAGWIKDESIPGKPEEMLSQKEERLEIIKAFKVLNKQEEEVIQLKFSGELKNREVAEVLGISANNVGVILFRALQKLKAELAPRISAE